MAQASALAPHRAVYELRLAQTQGKSQVVSVRGRILYDFGGSSCEGYELYSRQVSELNNSEGQSTLSDQRATTWEDGAGKSYRFRWQNFVNERAVETVDGNAERQDNGAVTVKLKQPIDKSFDLGAAVVFPTQHVAEIIAAARAGKTIVELPVYDGAEKGDKLYATLTVIGREIAPGAKPATDAGKDRPELARLKRWPVTVSYFDGNQKAADQTPIYALSFELYENGISRALVLDYTDFSINGEMTSLDLKPVKPCP